jgi:hypothetical protein
MNEDARTNAEKALCEYLNARETLARAEAEPELYLEGEITLMRAAVARWEERLRAFLDTHTETGWFAVGNVRVNVGK